MGRLADLKTILANWPDAPSAVDRGRLRHAAEWAEAEATLQMVGAETKANTKDLVDLARALARLGKGVDHG